MYEKYKNELTRVLDKLAPEKTKLFIKKEKRPWFNEYVANMKRVLRRCEKIWVRNGTEDSWRAYQQARSLYPGKIVEKKRETICKKIEECSSDSRKIFQLVNHLTGHKPENPLPARNINEELADEFADFFHKQDCKIRQELDEHPLYQPFKSYVPGFNNFRELDEVQKLIIRTKPKSCELDPIPTTLLKSILPAIIETNGCCI